MSAPDFEEQLKAASDADPQRTNTALWAVIDRLAEERGFTVPEPLTARYVTISLHARFPKESRSVESTISGRLTEIIQREYMEGGEDLMGYDGLLVDMWEARIHGGPE